MQDTKGSVAGEAQFMAVDLPHGIKPSVLTPDSATDGWKLVMSDEGPSHNAAQAETLFSLANGALGVRGGREEQSSPTDGALLAGVFESVPISYHESFPGFARASDTRVPVADGKRIRVRLGDTASDIPPDSDSVVSESWICAPGYCHAKHNGARLTVT